jgi:hypothetical protein
MNAFPEPQFADNLGGCRQFQFIPVEDVISMPDHKDYVIIEPPVVKFGKTFLIAYSTPKTLIFTEKQENNAAGTFFIQNITGFYPRVHPVVISLFKSMQNRKFLAVITDNNKYVRLAGSLEQPLEFRYSLSTGNTPTERNGISYEFFCQSPHPAFFYKPQIIDENPIFNPTD